MLFEAESDRLRSLLTARQRQISSSLLRVEAGRILLRNPPRPERQMRLEAALGKLDLIAINDAILERAAMLAPPELRSLDAIHLATALTLPHLEAFVTYDRRLANAARHAGLAVHSPGAEV